MKLIIQIPCLNEEAQLPATLADLPRTVPGFDEVEWLVIDDGSTDRTIDVAFANGVDHVIRLPQNKGLATGFQAGLDASVKLGADVIVNTDADNQYAASSIPDLVRPLLDEKADLAIGDRGVAHHPEFSLLKRKLQVFGSWTVGRAAGTPIPDATSGFRAYTRESAMALTVVNRYTYTLESIIQAGKSRSAVVSVPVGTNPATRSSRLFGSTWGYVRKNFFVISRVFAAYSPLAFFGGISALLMVGSLLAFMPFLVDWILNGRRDGHLQSIVLGAILMLGAVQIFVLAVVADLIASHRMVSQRALERVRRIELAANVAPSHYLSRSIWEADHAPDRPDAGDVSR